MAPPLLIRQDWCKMRLCPRPNIVRGITWDTILYALAQKLTYCIGRLQ